MHKANIVSSILKDNDREVIKKSGLNPVKAPTNDTKHLRTGGGLPHILGMQKLL